MFCVATANVDETIYMFSPKVLDRAFTLGLGTVNLKLSNDFTGTGGDSKPLL